MVDKTVENAYPPQIINDWWMGFALMERVRESQKSGSEVLGDAEIGGL